MRFNTDANGTALSGTLGYRAKEHAFDFAPSRAADLAARTGPDGTTSIALGTLQLELDVTSGSALYAWGYSSRAMWTSQALPAPELTRAAVRVQHDAALRPGVAVDFPNAKRWTFRYDPTSGWVHCGEDPPVTLGIEIASGVGLAIENGMLRGVWLHPVIEP